MRQWTCWLIEALTTTLGVANRVNISSNGQSSFVRVVNPRQKSHSKRVKIHSELQQKYYHSELQKCNSNLEWILNPHEWMLQSIRVNLSPMRADRFTLQLGMETFSRQFRVENSLHTTEKSLEFEWLVRRSACRVEFQPEKFRESTARARHVRGTGSSASVQPLLRRKGKLKSLSRVYVSTSQ